MSPDLPIRVATLEDAVELARLISVLGYPAAAADVVAAWGAFQAQGNVALVVAGEDRLLGMVTLHSTLVFHRPRPVGRVTSLAVDPSAQGRGLGRALMRAAEEALMQDGCGLVEVTSNARRSEAHGFYEHLGYERSSFRFTKVLR